MIPNNCRVCTINRANHVHSREFLLARAIISLVLKFDSADVGPHSYSRV